MMGLLRDWFRTSIAASKLDRGLLRSLKIELRAVPTDPKTAVLDDEGGHALIVSKIGPVTVIDDLNHESMSEMESDFNLGAERAPVSSTRYGWHLGILVKNDTSYLMRKTGEMEYEHAEDPPTLRQALRVMRMDMRMGTMLPTNDEVRDLVTRLRRGRQVSIEDLQKMTGEGGDSDE